MAVCGKVGTIYTCTDTGNAIDNGTNFAQTVGDASCGDTIILPAGVEFTQPSLGSGGSPIVTLPNKSCSENDYVTIQSSNIGSLTPNTRVSYADISNMPTIRGATNSFTIAYANGAGWYKWRGILFTTRDLHAAPVTFSPTLVYTNTDDSATLHDVVYDQCVFRPYEESLANPDSVNWRSVAWAMRLDGENNTVKNSYFGGFCCQQSNGGGTSQNVGIGIVTGKGPYTIENNFIEAYGWNIFTGGGGNGGPANSATLTSVSNNGTTWQATFSNTTGLVAGGVGVGTLLRMDFSTPWTGTCFNASVSENNNIFGSTYINTIVGNVVTGIWVGPGGSIPPSGALPTTARWNPQKLMSNITVVRNTFSKRSTWTSNSGQCKSFWEIKDGSNILLEGNIFHGPVDTVTGTYCPINASFATNQAGANPWVRTDNIVEKNNLMCGVGSIFSSQPYDSYCFAEQGANIEFSNNLLINPTAGGRFSFFINTQHGDNWGIFNNTVVAATRLMHPTSVSMPTTGVVFRDNVVTNTVYYFNGISAYPGIVTNHNLVEDASGLCNGVPSFGNCNGWVGGTGDQVVANMTDVGFVNLTDGLAINGYCVGGDYHSFALAPSSPGFGTGTGGANKGVDFDALDAALSGDNPPVDAADTAFVGKVTLTGNLIVH